jgi:hypothetical protein
MRSWRILRAEDTLNEFGPTLKTDDFFDLQLIATGSREAAERATQQRIADAARRDQKVE